ncbi:MAG: hypothetical protein WC623_22270 [Pedobacter sp.]|uniref:hypothetical protein n=1 Tax=Pedobacter sp. TaxID=1411316 RepID=UPI00356A079A
MNFKDKCIEFSTKRNNEQKIKQERRDQVFIEKATDNIRKVFSLGTNKYDAIESFSGIIDVKRKGGYIIFTVDNIDFYISSDDKINVIKTCDICGDKYWHPVECLADIGNVINTPHPDNGCRRIKEHTEKIPVEQQLVNLIHQIAREE